MTPDNGWRERVAAHLHAKGPLTAKEIRQALGVSRRTLYGVLKTLVAIGVVATRASLKDSRQNLYWVSTQGCECDGVGTCARGEAKVTA